MLIVRLTSRTGPAPGTLMDQAAGVKPVEAIVAFGLIEKVLVRASRTVTGSAVAPVVVNGPAKVWMAPAQSLARAQSPTYMSACPSPSASGPKLMSYGWFIPPPV